MKEIFFIDELFDSISLQKLNFNTRHYLSLVCPLIDLSIGNKITKANRISREIINITPDASPFIYPFLYKVLKFLSHTLNQSTQLTLVPLQNLFGNGIHPKT